MRANYLQDGLGSTTGLTKEGKDMLRIHIENDASLNSLLGHLPFVPNNPFGKGRPLRTIHQTFEWEEPLPAACQR